MDYKSTLNLPRTEFPMKANLPQKEPERLAWWEQERVYNRIQESRNGCPLYILHDGPPYANGHIHIGHGLNKILKDIIIKSKTMAGFQAPYIPGWDCHGLPIEHQVTKLLGPKKKELSSVELRKLCREYADKFVHIQRDEFRRLGVFGDWEHPYLTMDTAYEAAIIREFGKFVEKGRVYKGLKPVLWCTVDQTALAEAEVEYEDHVSPSVYVKFPFANSPEILASEKFLNLSAVRSLKAVSVVIWTTTPWTLPANQAVCLHPEFEYVVLRNGDDAFIVAVGLEEPFAKACGFKDFQVLGKMKGKEFEGWVCHPPFSRKEVPILNGEFVTLEQGTGCVHIAPGHGMDDYLLVLKYNKQPYVEILPNQKPLEIVVPVNDAGKFTDEFPECAGQPVLEANQGIIELLKSKGRLIGEKKVEHSYPHCWRCKQPVIFRATHQWFVSMEKGDLRSEALNQIDRVQWIPERGRERIYGMILNRPDWCLSRQRMWGTPIPVFSCQSCSTPLADPKVIEHVAVHVQQGGADVWFTRSASELLPTGIHCPQCGGNTFKKEHDILDVWFESGVSHAAVLKPQGERWWPADLYLEGSDQHRGWFHSSLLTAVTTDGQAPYRAVLTHGFVVDGEGKKMSKSAGNVITPQEIIKESGAEVLRLWVASQDYQEDLRISKDILKQLVEAYRKIRNTCRFLLSNLFDFQAEVHAVSHAELAELDQWALWRLGQLIRNVRKGYEQFQFRQVVHEIDYFCSTDMSATYLDILKDRLYTFPANSALRRGSQTVLLEIVTALAKLMAPVLSFTSEEIWQVLPESTVQGSKPMSVHVAEFPEAPTVFQDPHLHTTWNYLFQVRNKVQFALEKTRREKVIGSSLEAKVVLHATEPNCSLLKRYVADLPALFIVSCVTVEAASSLSMTGAWFADATLDLEIEVVKAEGNKCDRCWNIRQDVGSQAQHPTLCGRCVEALG
ncbi:MAG: isoleucine--tRNA ligase [Nitrospirota bacterium]|nr:isoleucine--tRNA ligase [Nitrospirota bacterium]